MDNKKDVFGRYIRSVFDLNRDGKITFKEFISVVIPSNAVAIAIIVVDLLVGVAEYRVWDIGYKLTQSPIKAVGFVLISAVPFYLSQVLWLYPRANFLQRSIAIVMGSVALWTSAQFGLADLTLQYDMARVYSMVINLTVFYIIILLVYIVFDDSVKLKRMEVNTKARAAFQAMINKTAEEVLSNLEKQLAAEQRLRQQYGDDAVDSHMQKMGAKPLVQYNSEEKRPNP